MKKLIRILLFTIMCFFVTNNSSALNEHLPKTNKKYYKSGISPTYFVMPNNIPPINKISPSSSFSVSRFYSFIAVKRIKIVNSCTNLKIFYISENISPLQIVCFSV